MCFIVKEEEPTFGEMSREFHHRHVEQIRTRHDRLNRNERAERERSARIARNEHDTDMLDRVSPGNPSVRGDNLRPNLVERLSSRFVHRRSDSQRIVDDRRRSEERRQSGEGRRSEEMAAFVAIPSLSTLARRLRTSRSSSSELSAPEA